MAASLGVPGDRRGQRGITAGAEQVPLARPAQPSWNSFVCLFITQVFFKIIRRGQPTPSPLALTLRGVISVQIFLR